MLTSRKQERKKTVNMAWEESQPLTVHVFPLWGGLKHRLQVPVLDVLSLLHQVEHFYCTKGPRVICYIFGIMAYGYYLDGHSTEDVTDPMVVCGCEQQENIYKDSL